MCWGHKAELKETKLILCWGIQSEDEKNKTHIVLGHSAEENKTLFFILIMSQKAKGTHMYEGNKIRICWDSADS